MRYRPFGRTGWRVSEVGYGMWGMGGWSGRDDAASLAALERAVELGCNFFDTAWAYGAGHSERLFAQLKRRCRGKQLYLATKVPPKNMAWPARPEFQIEDVYPPEHIRAYTEKSCANLELDTIDLLQLHVWDDTWSSDPGWQHAIADLKRRGVVRAFGISLNRWEPENALVALRTGLVDAVQVVYNIFDQAAEDRLLPLCRELGVAVIARVPFDEGSLTGTLTSKSTWPEGDWRNSYFTAANLLPTLERVERLQPLVPAGMTLPELALRFILANQDVGTVIPGMRRREHVDANLAASDGRALPAALRDRLRAHRWDRKPAKWSA
ncbi:MAG: aldo/keto reductase [Planctomycetota bacterium]